MGERRIVLAAAAIGLGLAALVGLALDRATSWGPESAVPPDLSLRPARQDAPPRRDAPVRQDGVVSVPPRPRPPPPQAGIRPGPASSEAAPADPSPPRRPATLVLQPPFTIEDGPVLASRSGSVRLARIEAPRGDAVCFDADRRLWACGSRMAATLRQLVGDRGIACRPVEAEAQPPVGECASDGGDLARALVALGYARPVGGQEREFGRELAEAKAARRGLWNGGWAIR